jgi:hypothetical protein
MGEDNKKIPGIKEVTNNQPSAGVNRYGTQKDFSSGFCRLVSQR